MTSPPIYCNVCNISFDCPAKMHAHVKTKKHIENERRYECGLQNNDPRIKNEVGSRFCQYCNMSFDRSSNLTAHLKTKKHQKNVENYQRILQEDTEKVTDEIVEDDKISPMTLSLEFLMEEIKKRDAAFVKYQKDLVKYKEETHKSMEKQRKELVKLRNELEVCKNRSIDDVGQIINGDINHSTVNMNKYINENQFRVELHVHAFGSEDLSYITDSVMSQLMSQPMSFINRWVRHVHFNELYPQNMNIKIKNVKDDVYQIYNGDTWRNVDKGKFLEYMVADIFGQAETRNCTDDSSIELWKTLPDRYKPMWVNTIEQATDGVHPNHKAFVKDLKKRLDSEIKTQQKKYDDRKKAVNDKRLRVWHKLPPTIETQNDVLPTKNPYKCIKGLINTAVI